jgi:2-keto-3-deoxy-L-rhamnonate aldolase RhmA
MPLDAYVRTANQQTFVVVQLEQASAIDRIEEIAAVPGIDAMMLGPADFSVLNGSPGQIDNSVVRAAKKRIAAAARNAGIHWGSTCGSTRDVQEMLEAGAGFVCYGADIVTVKRGLEQIRSECAALGFCFDAPAESRVRL